ncbi:MAG TPA: ATP-binding protein [Candidatus Acidoferrum sp.]|nr:ATP-binding protein [Candidatus Acidoferrum sp.]
MWAWRKNQNEEGLWQGAARAGLSGASREALLREALHALAKDGRSDRIGVWLEPEFPVISDAHAPASLRGLLWEAHGEATPSDWEKLSLEPPMPQELLAAGKPVEQELDASMDSPIIGPLVGMRHALWTPIQGTGHLHGVLLNASSKKQASLPRELACSVAAELALCLELEQEKRQARERLTDFRVNKQILAALGGNASSDTILSQIAATCTEVSADASGPGASFAVIGYLPASEASATVPAEMEFVWESGDTEWTRSIEREPLSALWKQALAAGHVVGIEPPPSWSREGLARLVAIPLLSSGEPLGVLVAGIPQKSSSLATLERIEMRAALAVSALQRRRLHTERNRRTVRRQALLESSPEATALLDARGRIASLNRSAKLLLGEMTGERTPAPREQELHAPHHEPGWYIGASFATLFSAREQPVVEEWLGRALAGERDKAVGSLESCEAELVNGRRAVLRAPIAAADDLAAVVLGAPIMQEASEQRTRSAAELRNVLEWVEEGILLFGANQSVRAMNTRFAQISGLSPEEAATCSTLDGLIARLADRAAEPEAFARRWRELARGTEGGTREELHLARPVPRVLERSVRPVLDHMGRLLGRVEIYRDLTAQRVFQAKLLQTEKLAALGQMVTGVAHELSNPLTSILGYSQRLLVRKDLAGRTEEARQIYQEAERASTILRQLLLTARETRPERKKVALNEVVLRAMELQRFGSAAEKIRVELDLDPTLPFVAGDPGQLQQVLMNLIGNARQAIVQEGTSGTIRLRTAFEGRSVLLQVIDDGPGVPGTILARIFDPFFTTKPAGVGTGLGLSIVLSVVREHGGQVKVSSPPEGGAIFSVEFPVASEAAFEALPDAPDSGEERSAVLRVKAGRKKSAHASTLASADAAAHATSHETSHATSHPAPRSAHRGTRILVVEDEPTVARLIADVLEDEGLHVDVLFDGREALDRAAREPYDLVICDMKLPGLDGQHFFQSLARAQNPLKEKFLFVTGDVIAQQTQEFLERNLVPHVAKPFRVEELTEKVFGLLDGQLARGGRAAAARKAH